MTRARDVSRLVTTPSSAYDQYSEVVVSSASPSSNTKIWINTSTASAPIIETFSFEKWRGTRLADTRGYFIATGGTVTTFGSYRIHTFNSSSDFVVTAATDVTTNAFAGTVEYLMVGGGGAGGGGQYGGGGGAGGYKTGTLTISATSYGISVGAGGVTNYAGSDSTAFSLSAIGGGYGGAYGGGGGQGNNGGNGGSGGGGSSNTGTGGTGTAGQGSNGGTGNGNAGAGGGGSASAGTNTSSNGGAGSGTSNSISGSSITYAVGGNGGGGSPSGANGTANRGNGGSAGSGNSGGSGIVIIRYEVVA
jgi:hypothetical protein